MQPLRAWHHRLGVPTVRLVDGEDERGKPRKRAEVEVPEFRLASADPQVIDAFYGYQDALRPGGR